MCASFLRFSSAAIIVYLGLLAVGSSFAADPPAQREVPPAAAAPAAASPNPAAATSSEAAAKHAKRTACLKDARAKKLLGADKTSFLNACMAAP
jgi:hypothetical protein